MLRFPLSAVFMVYVMWRQGKMHVFSLSLLYYANADFFWRDFYGKKFVQS